MPADVSIPHFSLPLRLSGGRFAVNDQDSNDEVAECVEAIVRCSRGFRVELPTFGVPDPTFAQQDISPAALEQAVLEWEPRADTDWAAEAEEDDTMIAHVVARVRGGSRNG